MVFSNQHETPLREPRCKLSKIRRNSILKSFCIFSADYHLMERIVKDAYRCGEGHAACTCGFSGSQWPHVKRYKYGFRPFDHRVTHPQKQECKPVTVVAVVWHIRSYLKHTPSGSCCAAHLLIPKAYSQWLLLYGTFAHT
eukprot:1157065-Pelagomonas_calceolata.AAC.16